MDLGTLRKRCEARLRDLRLPQPFNVLCFCESVARQRGRPIILHPISAESGPFGLWVAGPSLDVIFYEQETSPLHQDHIVLHELCHLICEHRPIPLSDAAIAELLCPHLDAIAIQRVLGRVSYATDEEREAELLASLILEHVTVSSPSHGTKFGRDAVLDRLEKSLAGEQSEKA